MRQVTNDMTQRATEIILVRHGETQGNSEGLFHGRTDMPLTTLGLRQAEMVAARLATELSIDGLYSSPLQRALVTAKRIGEKLSLEPEIDPRLTEIDFGALEGLSIGRFASEFPDILQAFQAGLRDVTFPGGESMLAFHARVETAILELLAHHAGQRVIVVAHGGVIGSSVIQLTRALDANWRTMLVGNCSLTSLEVDADGIGVLRWWNDVAHLAMNESNR
ncbi:MAG TPA: histidine phosphatase family protein [Thermomicrobiaceae bacterium]|nr:histidine phosphatase family protein [Thermomicrobiaceae bacterium]